MAFASPRRTARETSDSAGRFHSVFPRTVLPNMSKYHRANDVRPYGIPFQEPQVDVGIDPYSNNTVTNARQRQLWRLQAPGGQRGQRAFPPDGFTVFSPEQCYRICQSITGRTMFAPTVFLFKSHGSMWASTPTVITQLQMRGKGNYGVCKPQADSESSERFRRTVSQCFPQGNVAEYVKVSSGEP